MRAKKVLLLPIRGGGNGQGHYLRSRELEQSLRASGWETQLSVSIDDTSCLKAIDLFQPQLVVLDRRENTSRLLKSIERLNIKTVLLDTLSHKAGNVEAVIETIPSLEDRCGRANLIGTDYLVPVPDTKTSFDFEPGHFLIYLGGPDDFRFIENFLRLSARIFAKWKKEGSPLKTCQVFLSRSKLEKVASSKVISDLVDHSFPTELEISFQEAGHDKKSFTQLLKNSDALLTYFGISALEAISLGVPVVLLDHTSVHYNLSQKHLKAFSVGQTFESDFELVVNAIPSLESLKLACQSFGKIGEQFHLLPNYFEYVLNAEKKSCPACASKKRQIISRRSHANQIECATCGLVCLEAFTPIDFVPGTKTEDYSPEYFLDEYKKSYGKTYEEDRENIYGFSKARLAVIGRVLGRAQVGLSLIDIGAALGYFLDQASVEGFQTHGVELSEFAAKLVSPKHSMLVGDFSTMDFSQTFDVVTLWYVIEHFHDLKVVFAKIASMQKVGGILAMGTPNSRGLSPRFFRSRFYAGSPNDHFVVLSAKAFQSYLKPFGYRLMAIRPTGVHFSRFAERFPRLGKWLPKKVYELIARQFNLGDTFEVYFKKIK